MVRHGPGGAVTADATAHNYNVSRRTAIIIYGMASSAGSTLPASCHAGISSHARPENRAPRSTHPSSGLSTASSARLPTSCTSQRPCHASPCTRGRRNGHPRGRQARPQSSARDDRRRRAVRPMRPRAELHDPGRRSRVSRGARPPPHQSWRRHQKKTSRTPAHDRPTCPGPRGDPFQPSRRRDQGP